MNIIFYTSCDRYLYSYWPALDGTRAARPVQDHHHFWVSIEGLPSILALRCATFLVRGCSLIVGVYWEALSGQRSILRVVCEVLPMKARRLTIAINVGGY